MAICGFVLGLSSLKTQAAVIFYTNESQWALVVASLETFEYTSANVNTANEVAIPPTTDEEIFSQVLTFDSANTGLSRSFSLTTLQPGYNWVFEDENSFADTLSPGEISAAQRDDDFRIDLTSGPSLTAFGIYIIDNGNIDSASETFEVFDTGNASIGTTTLPFDNGGSATQFIGVISTDPIGSIVVNEGAVLDSIFIGRTQFGVTTIPEPKTVALLILGLMPIFRRRLRRTSSQQGTVHR